MYEFETQIAVFVLCPVPKYPCVDTYCIAVMNCERLTHVCVVNITVHSAAATTMHRLFLSSYVFSFCRM